MPKKAPGSGKDVDMRLGSKRTKKEHEKHDGHGQTLEAAKVKANVSGAPVEIPTETTDQGNLFTRRLQKSKLKELTMKMREAQLTGGDTSRMRQEMDGLRKAVFTDERKLDQRK